MGDVAQKRHNRNIYKILRRRPKGKNILGDQRVNLFLNVNTNIASAQNVKIEVTDEPLNVGILNYIMIN